MLPIRFASFGLGHRLGGMLLLLLLEGAFLGSGEAAPLKAPGVDKIRTLLDSKNDPTPSRKDAPGALVDYRRKVAKAVDDLPSLGDVGRALLLTDWNLIELGSESPDVLDKAKEAVSADDDEAFERAIRNMLAMTKDSAEIVRAIITQIKHKARLDLLKRLETRSRFYLRGGQREEDRIAAANLLSDIMMDSRRQDRQEALTSLAMLREPTQRQTTPSARQLRRRIAELAGDLREQLSASNPQVQVAAIRALSDLEIPSEELVAALRPKLVSKESPAVVRRAAAEACEHALARVLEGLANLMDESRPQPRVKTVEHILPVVVLGLADDDANVRQASIVACERATRILDELTRYQMPPERSVVFQPIVQVVKDVLPKINDATRDRVPALRVAACRVLETLALSALRLRQLNATRPIEMLPEPVKPKPYTPPPKEDRRDKKGVSLPLSRGGRRPAGPSQWATARAPQPLTIPSPPPLPETPTPAVTLERPIKLPTPNRVLSSEFRVLSPHKTSELRTQNSELTRCGPPRSWRSGWTSCPRRLLWPVSGTRPSRP
ncbi:MAG TPA: hypothetical protein VMG10_24970 [Gemmataceae bacterium]|nr:hypothetical protein [Gemmataceae bacterium]